jgi:hypothetical protein
MACLQSRCGEKSGSDAELAVTDRVSMELE